MADYTKAGIPVVSEDVADRIREVSEVTGLATELESAIQQISTENPQLAELLDNYVSTMPQACYDAAFSAALFLYHALESQSEDNQGMPDTNGTLH